MVTIILDRSASNYTTSREIPWQRGKPQNAAMAQTNYCARAYGKMRAVLNVESNNVVESAFVVLKKQRAGL